MYRIFIVTILVLLVACTVSATVVTLPNETQTTTFTANVSPQANFSVPAGVTFNVTNVSADTNSAAQTVSATNVVMIAGASMMIYLKADAANFTAATGGTVTWAASDVTWNAATWTNVDTSYSGTLSSSSYNELVMTNTNISSTTTSNLVFTLGDKASVDRAGNHTLVCTWKIWGDT